MQIIQSYLEKNPCYQFNLDPKDDPRYISFQTQGPQGIMLHLVRYPYPSTLTYVESQNHLTYGRGCVHGLIDADTGIIYQTLPWNYRAWHSGGNFNDTHIGIELSEPDCIAHSKDYLIVEDAVRAKNMATRIYEVTVELCVFLCQKYGWDPLDERTIITHAQGYKENYFSKHNDPIFLWETLGLDYTLSGLREEVFQRLNALQEEAVKNIDNAESVILEEEPQKKESSPQENFLEYRVKINVNSLNYRDGPGIQHEVIGAIKDKGTYTIVQEKNGWGKINHVGWICLAHTKKL